MVDVGVRADDLRAHRPVVELLLLLLLLVADWWTWRRPSMYLMLSGLEVAVRVPEEQIFVVFLRNVTLRCVVVSHSVGGHVSSTQLVVQVRQAGIAFIHIVVLLDVLTFFASVHVALWPVTHQARLADRDVLVGAGTQLRLSHTLLFTLIRLSLRLLDHAGQRQVTHELFVGEFRHNLMTGIEFLLK